MGSPTCHHAGEAEPGPGVQNHFLRGSRDRGWGNPGAEKQPRWADPEALLLFARCWGAALPGSVFLQEAFHAHESLCQVARHGGSRRHCRPTARLGVAFLKVTQ